MKLIKKQKIMIVIILAAVATAIAVVLTYFLLFRKNADNMSVSYTWDGVALGGGSHITGIVYNPTEEGLCYARTSSGAYRYDKSQNKWIVITDRIDTEGRSLSSIESIATDSVDPKRVYIAAGGDVAEKGAILASDDYGKTWTRADMNFGCGGSQSGRGVGERLAVDPKNNKNVWFGSRNDGMWKSSDYGKSWNKQLFPSNGSYGQGGVYMGIMWVKFDPVSGDIYAGTADPNGQTIYTSSDGGSTWDALPVNATGLFPVSADISSDGYLYIVYADTCAPDLIPGKSSVYKYNIESKTFTDITPADNCGFGKVSADSLKYGAAVVSTIGLESEHGDNIYRTTDGGETWESMFTDRAANYQTDVTEADWLRMGADTAIAGHNITSLSINPFNSDEVSYGTDMTLFTVSNMTSLGSGVPVTVKFNAYGISSGIVYDVLSPVQNGSSPQLYSLMKGLTGFSHTNTSKCPDDAHSMTGGKAVSIDCAQLNGEIAVYTTEEDECVIYTKDGGKSWHNVSKLPDKGKGGTVAVAADGSAFIWCSPTLSSKPFITTDFGETWYYCSGLGYGSIVIADKVNPQKFYAVCDGFFYVSNNGGYNFEKTGYDLNSGAVAQAVSGLEGHVWITANDGNILYTEDSGKNFTAVGTFNAERIGFGVPEEESGYPVIYAAGNPLSESGGERDYGIYRSLDKGITWQWLSGQKHLFSGSVHALTGDSTVSGRVYVATDGRGILIGDYNSNANKDN